MLSAIILISKKLDAQFIFELGTSIFSKILSPDL